MDTQTIELDCAPGMTRPDSYIEGVIADTGLPSRDPISKLFGNWIWDFSDVPRETYLAVRPTLEARVKALYHAGCIRYGSW